VEQALHFQDRLDACKNINLLVQLSPFFSSTLDRFSETFVELYTEYYQSLLPFWPSDPENVANRLVTEIEFA